jgi:hypothetical protein
VFVIVIEITVSTGWLGGLDLISNAGLLQFEDGEGHGLAS